MDIARLHQMVEQIAANLAVRGHDRAAAATADHLTTFWDPRMKAAIIGADNAALSPIARSAIELVASGAIPLEQTGATTFNEVHETGHSDAG